MVSEISGPAAYWLAVEEQDADRDPEKEADQAATGANDTGKHQWEQGMSSRAFDSNGNSLTMTWLRMLRDGVGFRH